MRKASATATLSDWGEVRFLDWVRRTFDGATGGGGIALPISIGDDAAHLRLKRERDLLVTTDALIENVHFKWDWISPRDLGAKSLAANLSDLAAMGAVPVAAFLALGVPGSTSVTQLKNFFLGLRATGHKWKCPLAGGDLVRARHWTIALTLLGRPSSRGRVIRRSTARRGQTLYVTGRLGESAAGLAALKRGDRCPKLLRRHRRPTPRLEEAKVLTATCRDLTMIDLSDGIMTDATHLATESSVGIEIDVGRLPLPASLKRYAAETGIDVLDWAIYGGEDYELLFTTRTSENAIRRAMKSKGLKTPISAIGRVIESRSTRNRVRLIGEDGKRVLRADRTFRHFS